MEKINVAEMLKDSPKGMELDCTMYEDVYFDYVDELNIIHCYIKNEGFKTSITFNQHGTPNSYIKSKCVIFPKGKTTWGEFVPFYKFKDGDIVFSGVSLISIFKNIKKGYNESLHSYVSINENDSTLNIDRDYWTLENIRFATEEEKQKLFQAIKDNGYEWNAETKTLEKLLKPYKKETINKAVFDSNAQCCDIMNHLIKEETNTSKKLIEPKFKIGDRIKSKLLKSDINTITKVCDNHYELDDGCALALDCQDNWELAPNKFDINTLIPFESKILVRDKDEDTWHPAIWGCTGIPDIDTYPYIVMGGIGFEQCIPYEGNEHLCRTTKDCNTYYKIWE